MRIKLTLFSDNLIKLDFQYPLLLRALIYHLLPDDFAQFLHDTGYSYEKRNFKLFTFSRIFGHRHRALREPNFPLVFEPQIHFYLSSPVNEILEYVANESLKRGGLRLGSNRVFLKAIEVENPQIFSEKVRIRMLSPMAIRSTVTTAEGKKKSYYYHPQENEFSELMRRNLEKKYHLVYRQALEGHLKITPCGRNKERILKGDRNFIIKAWDGYFELEGTPELIQLSYDTGLGEKNSLGLGMWEKVEK